MTVYNKLIRDKVPDQLRAKGIAFTTRIITDDDEYVALLADKLVEEANEFKFGLSIEELAADVQEVVLALFEALDVDAETIRTIRATKHRIRGGFKERIFLESTETVHIRSRSSAATNIIAG